MEEKQGNISINLEYPYNDKYDYTTSLVRLDMDKTRENDIKTGKGFIISKPKGVKKDIKEQTGIYSHYYASNSITDSDSFSGRYRCKCGLKKGSINHGEFCPSCNTVVRYVDDDISITGYLVLNDYYIIHPNLYCSLQAFIGTEKITNIIKPDMPADEDGLLETISPVKKDEPFKGIGLIEFYNRFDEIMSFYLNKYPNKVNYYEDIMANKNILWTHTISVYSSLLRPKDLNNETLVYETCNEEFALLHRLVYEINNNSLSIKRKKKDISFLLFDIQCNLNELYNKIKSILEKKKGDIRSALGGRYSFTSRSVIRQDVSLKADQVKMPFYALCELLQQVIINLLVRSYNFSYSDAYKKWSKCQITEFDQNIYDIIDGLIKQNDGLPVLINRNPTISYGGILSCKVVGINMDYTLSVSLLVLKALAADFDGDTLNTMYLYNKEFIRLADKILSPKNMFISRNDGRMNKDFIHSRDTIINANSLKSLYHYSEEEIMNIKRLQEMV